MTKRHRKKKIALYHDMQVEQNFDKCAHILFRLTKQAQETSPGQPRAVYLDVQGHRNDAGGYDHDAYELMTHFLIGFLGPYLTDISCPLFRGSNPRRQRNDLPDELLIHDPTGEHRYDHWNLSTRSRERSPDPRPSRPSTRAIASYLGLEHPICLVCDDTSVERAHAVPLSLGGSNDIRNFALLCARHHREAPDVADGEAFWSWVDDAYDRYQRERRERLDTSDIVKPVQSLEPTLVQTMHTGHFDRVKAELIDRYGWDEDDFSDLPWDGVMSEFHHVLESATGSHFGVTKKSSTEAWAFDVARRRLASDARPAKSAPDETP